MQVTVTIRTTPNKFPGGTVGGEWRIELMRASDPSVILHQYEGPSPSANFDLVDGEAYNVRAYRTDAGDATLGPVITDQFTVGDDLVTLDVADSISTATAIAVQTASSRK